jgi:hypothetical protein
MRRTVFILLILAVIAIVGIYTFLEFRVSEIVFVDDSMRTWAHGKEMVVRRLYNSGVDVDDFFEKTENMLISAEFDDEDIFAAALASGNPEFFPAFYFSMYNPDLSENTFDFFASIRQEFAPKQTNFNFKIADLYLEVMTDGPMISSVELRPEDPSSKIPGTPVVSTDGRSLAIDLVNVSGYSFTITGTGRLTFQYTYNVATSNLISSVTMEDQLLIVHANISRGPNGEFEVEYILEPYSSLEDFLF